MAFADEGKSRLENRREAANTVTVEPNARKKTKSRT
jgi:hypothetical protein